MPRSAPLQNNFTAGEWSPSAHYRADVGKYANSLRRSRNMLASPIGSTYRRGGSHYAAPTKDATRKSVIRTFQFSDQQAYILEFGHLYIRFFTLRAQIESGGSPVEIATLYTEDQVRELSIEQSNDALYIAHKSHPPRKLTRASDTSWTLADLSFNHGPFFETNATTVTIQASAGTGSVTLTSNPGFWVATDVGRVVRIRGGSPLEWGWAVVTAYTNATTVTATVYQEIKTLSATTDWALGLWSGTSGYPACVTIFGGRLWFGGSNSLPQRIDGSETGVFDDFRPTEVDDTVLDTNAISVLLDSGEVNQVRWIKDGKKGLVIGTTDGEWSLLSEDGKALTPNSREANRFTEYGSATARPARAFTFLMAVEKTAKHVLQIGPRVDEFGLESYDTDRASLLAEHFTDEVVEDLAWQKSPHGTLWANTEQGSLLSMSFLPKQEVIGWQKHTLGGLSDADGNLSKVESVAVIPTPDGRGEDVWIQVLRYIDGSAVRYIEYLDQGYQDGAEQSSAFYVDSGLSYSGSAVTTVSGLDHLEGETVSILADGAAHPDKIVVSGSVTLDRAASVIHVGLHSRAYIQTQNWASGAADGTALGKLKRIDRVRIAFLNSLGCYVGPDPDGELDLIVFRDGGDRMDSPPPLFTGVKEVDWPGDYDEHGYLSIVQEQPLPMTILAIMPRGKTQDG